MFWAGMYAFERSECWGILQVEVGHDGEGPHAAWHLAWVRITNLDTQETATFECNKSATHPLLPPPLPVLV